MTIEITPDGADIFYAWSGDPSSTDTAYLKKNALGVPLHKYYEGKMVVRAPNEPFDRGYSATFYDYFDGTGYPGISELKIDPRACPYKR